jgi:hypothetical protein
VAVRDLSIEIISASANEIKGRLLWLIECVQHSLSDPLPSDFTKVHIRLDRAADGPASHDLLNVLEVVIPIEDEATYESVLEAALRALRSFEGRDKVGLSMLAERLEVAGSKDPPCQWSIWERERVQILYRASPDRAEVVLDHGGHEVVLAEADWPMPVQVLWPALRMGIKEDDFVAEFDHGQRKIVRLGDSPRDGP